MRTIRVTDNMAQLKGMANEWNDLLFHSLSNSIFLTWEWLYTWCEHFLRNDRKLFVLSVYEDEKVIAIAPWCMWCIRTREHLPHLKQVEFLGSPEAGSDYLDVFALKGKDKETSLRLYDYLFGEAESSWSSFALTDIRAESRFLLHFTEQLRRNGKYFSLKESAYCPVVRLPASWPDFLDSLSPHRKTLFGRHLRALKKNPTTRYETIPLTHADNGLGRYIDLYRSVAYDQDERFYDHLTRFVERCADKEWVEADFLNVDGKDAAGLLHFKYRGNFFCYSMAVDKDFTTKVSVGNVLVGLCLERAISQGVPAYDFLKGPYDFKFHWAETGSRSLALSFYGKHVGAIGALLWSMAKDLGKAALR